MNNKKHPNFIGILLVTFLTQFIIGCAKDYVLSDSVSNMSRTMLKLEAAGNVERYVNDDIDHRLKMVGLREEGLGVWGGTDALTIIKVGEEGFTFHNIYLRGKEISRDEYLAQLKTTLQSGVESGLFSEERKNSILLEQEKTISQFKIFAKERQDPVLIKYSEILGVAIDFNPPVIGLCGANKPLTLRSVTGNFWGPPPYTFFTICVPGDQFDNILASLIALMPHAIVEEFL